MGHKKKNKPARTRDWANKHEDAFTHDRAKHVKTQVIVQTVAREVPPEQANGVVVSHVGQWATVKMGDEERMCLIDACLFEGRSSILAAGDSVRVEPEGRDLIVRAVAPRRTKLSRLAHVHSRLTEQVIAANVDLLVIVASALQPRFKPGLVDRYWIMAERGRIEPLLVLNKMDLVETEPEAVQLYRDLGLSVCPTSCATGSGIEALRHTLCGKLSVLAGHSGVGKSSLLKALEPRLDLEIREVSAATEKGRHTTSSARLYELADGMRIIDTPGIRQLGLHGVSRDELAFYFPEMEPIAAQCRFRNCSHIHEPECAVREAVAAGRIPRRRYDSYCRILQSLN